MLNGSLPTTPHAAGSVLAPAEWRERALVHRERVPRWTKPHRRRQARHEPHPVYDFLFQYYSYSAGRLETWHPAPHEALLDTAEARRRFRGPVYRATDGVIVRDPGAIPPATRERLGSALRILTSTRERPANFGCFGLHEWAMVFGGHDVRHADVAPLRLPQHAVDALVASRPLVCSHYDAFRFFAPDARPLNRVQLGPSDRQVREQPGCIHANMDLYRWAYTAMPWIGSDLLWQCFELAAELRVLDMQASPYDLRALGFEPVRVETPEGRDEYQRRQRALSERAGVLRDRLIQVMAPLCPEPPTSQPG
jgi:hypothetical protein